MSYPTNKDMFCLFPQLNRGFHTKALKGACSFCKDHKSILFQRRLEISPWEFKV